VLLVINDNPYGLMVALSCIVGLVHRQCLNHLLVSRLNEDGNKEDYVMTKVLFKE
jgi:hypothetical protein